MFVPGSPLAIDHPFQWYAVVRHKVTGKQSTYWLNGSQATREQVANFLRDFHQNVDVLTIDQSNGRLPERVLVPVPPENFEYGVKKIIQAELGGDDDPEQGIVLPDPLTRAPLRRQSLVRR